MTDIQLTGFEVIDKLGEGGMAAVWKARQISLDRIVAIKILSSRFASDPGDIQRFQQEAQSAAKLKHPGIVQVYDANIESGLYFFVMEFVDGYTCADWLIRKGVLSEKDVLLIADCVSDALAYAWEREKIIHCDIKPDNIMIDEDGTVKVTDLGLSRTISGMTAGEECDEILGTPAYMAPEQAMGEANQDCRLDMYALGAMMYHLSTGKLLFENCDESEVMERQVNDTVENPKDLNPSLSLGFCKLVEVLMTKEKEGRPSDWSEVRDAINRVKKGHAPKLQLAEGMQSTVRRSVVADEAAAAKAARRAAQSERMTSAAPAKGSLVPIVAGIAVLVIIAAVAAKMFLGGGRPKPRGPVGSNGSSSGSGSTGVAANPVEEKAKRLYYSAHRWEQANKASYDSAIAKYQRVVDEAPDSQYAGRARRDIARLEESKKEMGVENALRGLAASARAWSRQHQYDRAIEIYASYSGPAASETKSQRDAEVAKLRAMKLEWEEAQKARREAEALERYNALLDGVVALVTRSDFTGASRMVQEASTSGGLQSYDDKLQDLIGSLEESANIGNVILQSFLKDKGRQVTVQFLTETKTVIVSDVTDSKVIAAEVMIVRGATASVERNFVLADLSVAEKLRRMGEDSNPAVAIVKGVMAYQSRAFSHARRYFEMSHHLLSTRLINLLGGAKLEAETAVGEAELAMLLKNVGITVAEPFDASIWSASVQAARLTSAQFAQVKQLASVYKEKHEDASFYSRVSPVVTALMNAEVAAASVPETAFVPPPVDLPPEVAGMVGNADRVVDALLAANPELGSEHIRLRRDDDGNVVSMRIRSSDISDISAVAALRDLREFEVEAHWRSPSKLSDLSALKGLPLERVNIRGSRITDLTPLRGLPIEYLTISNCDLRDLTPLRGMNLVNIDVSQTKVFDFMPLSQMPLTGLCAAGTQIKSLSFLRNAQLKSFNVNDTAVFDFSPLADMPLEDLRVSGTQFKMLDIVKNCPIRSFEANGTGIRDISVLRNFAQTMTSLALNECPVRIFTPLKSLDLDRLSLASTAFSDLALLSHMKLEYLNIAGSKVASLNGLDVSALEELNIERTAVSSIAALRGSPIEELYCKGSRVRNFMPIYDSAITRLSVDDPGSKWEVYGKLPALERVNGQWMKGNPQF